MPDDITSDGLPQDGTPGGAAETASESDTNALTLSELNGFLGKQYTSKEAALKSIKDTFSYTGKVGTLEKKLAELSAGAGQSSPAVSTEMESTVKALQAQLEEQTLFAERPELKTYQSTLRELRASTGKSLAELVSSEAMKPLFEKALAQDAAQTKRSVLESNPRLGQVRDTMQEAREALEKGQVDPAKEKAVSAVLSAYEL